MGYFEEQRQEEANAAADFLAWLAVGFIAIVFLLAVAMLVGPAT